MTRLNTSKRHEAEMTYKKMIFVLVPLLAIAGCEAQQVAETTEDSTNLHFSEIAANCSVTIASIMVTLGGAFWGWFKWQHEKRDDERRNVPALDAEICTNTLRLDDERAFVTLTMKWRNASPYIVKFDFDESTVKVYEIDATLPSGPVHHTDNLGEPIHDVPPFRRKPSAEPKTESQHAISFVLPFGALYLFRWRTELRIEKNEEPYSWTREAILDLRETKATGDSSVDGLSASESCGKTKGRGVER